jgi:hypothetical protein
MSGSRGGVEALLPVSGVALFEQEIERRRTLDQSGVLPTGCSEIDDALLLRGGFERGCVVGVSAEESDFAILVSFPFVLIGSVYEVYTIC